MPKSAKIAFAIIGVIVVSLIKNMGIILYISITHVYCKLRRWIHKKLDVKAHTKKVNKLKKQKQMEQQRRESEDRELLAAFFRGSLKPSQTIQSEKPSSIASMIRVEIPTPNAAKSQSNREYNSENLKRITEELQTNLKSNTLQVPLQQRFKWNSHKNINKRRLVTMAETDDPAKEATPKKQASSHDVVKYL